MLIQNCNDTPATIHQLVLTCKYTRLRPIADTCNDTPATILMLIQNWKYKPATIHKWLHVNTHKQLSTNNYTPATTHACGPLRMTIARRPVRVVVSAWVVSAWWWVRGTHMGMHIHLYIYVHCAIPCGWQSPDAMWSDGECERYMGVYVFMFLYICVHICMHMYSHI